MHQVTSLNVDARAAQLTVMRLCSAAVIFVLGGLVACASVDSKVEVREEFEHCSPTNPESWQLVAAPPDAKEILALPLEKGTLDTELAPIGSDSEQMHEHWFSSDDSHLAVCRHLVARDSCHSNSTLAYLTKVNGRWAAPNGVLESVCLVHERVR